MGPVSSRADELTMTMVSMVSRTVESIHRRSSRQMALGDESDAGFDTSIRTGRRPAAGSLALKVIAAVALVFLLHEAQSVFIPLVLGILLSYALNPIVHRLSAWHVPRAMAAVLVLALLLGAGTWGAWALSDDVSRIMNELPDAARQVRITLRDAVLRHDNPFGSLRQAASELQRAGSVDQPTSGAAATTSAQAAPSAGLGNMLWYGSVGAIALVVQATIVLFLVFFLLASGDLYKRKLLGIATTMLGHHTISAALLDDITSQIERFLIVRVIVSVMVAVGTWLAFWLLGLEEAAVWGIVAGVLNIIPYFGAMAVAVVTAVAAFTQFGTMTMALVVAGTSLAITGLEGWLVSPWLTGRATRMNTIAVFVGLVVWGWIWGVWGAILAVPLLAVIKAVCDRVENCKLIGDLLSE